MKKYFLISASITIIIYLFTSFVMWDITCIKNIPNLEASDRGLLVMMFLFKEILTVLIYKLKLTTEL